MARTRGLRGNEVNRTVADRPGTPSWLQAGSERRRSQRVLLVIPVEVSWTTREGVRVREHAETEIVSQHGVLLRMKSRVPQAREVQLTRPRTGKTVTARVVWSGEPEADGFARVGVELATPSTEFWGVIIPPMLGTKER